MAARFDSGFRITTSRNAVMLVAVLALSGCSVQRFAVRSLGDMLASGDSVYTSDDDPELIEDALPFGLKLLDGLLAQQPEHRGLLLAAGRGYLLYAHAFVATPAERAQHEDIERAQALRRRASGLFMRAHEYAVRALTVDYPSLDTSVLATDPAQALEQVGEAPARDVPVLYYAAASLGLAISSSRNEPALLARLPEVEAMLGRAFELDEDWNDGALHEFAISLAGAAPGARVDEASVGRHYERAVELSRGRRASPHVAYAETVAIPRQDRRLFDGLLEKALAVDVDALPSERLLNVLAQERARWLLDNAGEFILD